MKHTLKITLLLLVIFLASQIIGLFIVNSYVDHYTTEQTGNITWSSLPYEMERPEMPENTAFIYIIIAILIGTIIILLLIKFKKQKIWVFWFFLSVFITLLVAFKPLLGYLIPEIYSIFNIKIVDITALCLALLFAFLKIKKKNVYIHNFTELFIYGGIAAIFVPILNIFSVVMLLLIISAYDIYAVWQSKHMVKMAKFQAKSGLFAGLFIGYKDTRVEHKRYNKEYKEESIKSIKMGKKEVKYEEKEGKRSAVLGGGDIAFPLLFSGVILKKLMLIYPIWQGFLISLITPLCAGLALFGLLYFSKKDKFYPAMPYISVGCFVGLLITYLIAF